MWAGNLTDLRDQGTQGRIRVAKFLISPRPQMGHYDSQSVIMLLEHTTFSELGREL